MRNQPVQIAELLSLALGELSPADAARVESIAAANSETMSELQRVRTAIASMRSDDSIAPSSVVIAQAKRILSANAPQRPTWLDALQQLVAGLIYDSRSTPALAGYRSAQDAIQLTYAVDSDEIDVQLEPPADARESWTIFGQLPEAAASGTEACLLEAVSGAPVARAFSDAHGTFRLKAPAGRYTLAVRWDEQRAVRLEDLECR